MAVKEFKVGYAPQDKVELVLNGVADMCGGDMQEMLLVLASASTHLASVATEGIPPEAKEQVIITTSEGLIQLTISRLVEPTEKPSKGAITDSVGSEEVH